MPQPIDLPTELARTTAVERVQQAVDRQALAGQQRAAAEIDEQRQAAERQVREMHNKNEEIEPENRRRTPYRRRRRHRGEDSEEQAASSEHRAPLADGEEHHLDISI
ncbi:MAG: hypothetical protein GWP08_18040 [Nitrospiraceae bacterium]|nr:hypothetical protein [Nitrospiraceae bacterium]